MVKTILNRIIVLLVFAALWEIVFQLNVFPPLLFPSAFSIGHSLITGFAEDALLLKTLTTLNLVLWGLVCGIALALALFTISLINNACKRVVDSMVTLGNLIPGMAILPLAVLWFGLGQAGKVFIIVHSVTWGFIAYISEGRDTISPIYVDISRNLELGRFRRFVDIYLPACVPSMVAAGRIALSRAWRTAIAAELLMGMSSTFGLGRQMTYQRNTLDTAGLLACVIVIIFVGILFDAVFYIVECKTAVKWGLKKPEFTPKHRKAFAKRKGELQPVIADAELINAPAISREQNETMPVIELRNIDRVYNTGGEDYAALRNINLSVYAKEFLCILGKVGCGKSTLLRIVAGFDSGASGEALFEGKQITKPSTRCAFVFQSLEQLFPWKTALQNVVYPLITSKEFKKQCTEQKGRLSRGEFRRMCRIQAESYLNLVGLANNPERDILNRFPCTLSGGERQRVAIARALAIRPKVLLLDEPFSSLDIAIRDTIYENLRAVWKKLGITIVLVTHSLDSAIRLSTRVVVLKGEASEPSSIVLNAPNNVKGGKTTVDEGYAEFWKQLRENY